MVDVPLLYSHLSLSLALHLHASFCFSPSPFLPLGAPIITSPPVHSSPPNIAFHFHLLLLLRHLPPPPFRPIHFLSSSHPYLCILLLLAYPTAGIQLFLRPSRARWSSPPPVARRPCLARSAFSSALGEKRGKKSEARNQYRSLPGLKK